MTAHISCTATREGLTHAQAFTVRRLLGKILVKDRVLHHGDCIGGDAHICMIARGEGYALHSHPPSNSKLRAFVESDFVDPPKPYAERNLDIAEASFILIACPKEREPQTRGGTWMTVRMARELDHYVKVVWPDGSTTTYDPIAGDGK